MEKPEIVEAQWLVAAADERVVPAPGMPAQYTRRLRQDDTLTVEARAGMPAG